MAKYRVKAGHETQTVCTSAPEYRKGDGRFDLSVCTPRDLEYLYKVAKYPFIELIEDEQKATKTGK